MVWHLPRKQTFPNNPDKQHALSSFPEILPFQTFILKYSSRTFIYTKIFRNTPPRYITKYPKILPPKITFIKILRNTLPKFIHQVIKKASAQKWTNKISIQRNGPTWILLQRQIKLLYSSSNIFLALKIIKDPHISSCETRGFYDKKTVGHNLSDHKSGSTCFWRL